MDTIVYIDGFNLYYGSLKGGPYRWLDPAALCGRLLPADTILEIKYFTARVKALPNNPQAPQRQQAYLHRGWHGEFLQHAPGPVHPPS